MKKQTERSRLGLMVGLDGALLYFGLMRQLIKRDVLARFQGSYVGLFWLVLQPIILLLAYTLVFGIIFKVRWNGSDIGPLAYGLAIFVGMALHSLVADCLSRAPTLVTSRASFVKKVVFPLEILAPVQVAAATVQLAVALGLWLAAVATFSEPFGHAVLAIPLLLVPLILHALGLTWLLAALGVYVRDVVQGATLLSTALLFLSPVFYPVAAVPQPWQSFILLNPLTFTIEAVRSAVLDNILPCMLMLFVHTGVGSLVAVVGLACFRRARRGFADVI